MITKPAKLLLTVFAVGLSLTLFGAPVLADTNDDLLELKSQISGINVSVQKKKADLEALSKKMGEYQSAISQKKLESQTLEDEKALLDNRIAKQQLSIDIAREEIRSVELEIDLLDRRIAEDEKQMEKQRKLLGALARKLFREQFNRTSFEVLASYSTFSEYFDSVHSLSRLQLAVNTSLAEVQRLRQELGVSRIEREKQRLASQQYKRNLETAKLALEDERALKAELIEQTRSSELQYRYLLAELKHEQASADEEISYLEKTLRQKMNLADRLATMDAVLSWPVVPTRGLSSVFHDPDYPFRHLFEHPAVDIRAYQGTAVRAAAAGVVARAKNAGMGYSYVMLIHGNQLATVYGHLSKIAAKEDLFVERGEIIGYSGGMPGTSGAGRLTTGPHLHFEVRRDGIPVNPMNYLMSL